MIIKGTKNNRRLSSKELEELIQEAVKAGKTELEIKAQGQHGIGGRMWHADHVRIKVSGPVGQRLGCMGTAGTEIIVNGSASDDVGWLNTGATITVLGDVTNGAHNAGAQGILYVQGGGGARCDTMTKQNPRFAPLQSWYFRDVGDSFAEFKAGGIAVVCGVDPRHPDNVLGYRPCVGMVGGTIYVRGPFTGYNENDVQALDLDDQDWEWLTTNMVPFLKAVKRSSYLKELTRDRGQWKKIVAYTPAEKAKRKRKGPAMKEFRRQVWEKEVGRGGIFGDMLDHAPFTVIPYIATGKNRLQKPVWRNRHYAAPCAGACPADIPSEVRFSLLRRGKWEEAAATLFEYSPFPASVCGAVCPNMCMKACTRGRLDHPLDMKGLGAAALGAAAPDKDRESGHTVAVIGAGPAGLSAAWHLALKGHAVTLYETDNRLGGKLWDQVDKGRLDHDTLMTEINRIKAVGIDIVPGKMVTPDLFEKIIAKHDGVIVCCGLQKKDGKGLRFLTTDITVTGGKVEVDAVGRTSNPKVFMAGDVLGRGLPPHAIGQAMKSAKALHAQLTGGDYTPDHRATIEPVRINMEYYPPEVRHGAPGEFSAEQEAKRCVSCGMCRDCRLCETSCRQGAIYREETADGGFAYVVDEERCIGCGFCAGICPCGIWEMVAIGI